MNKYLWFDLDGTIYNLYAISDWEKRLRAEDETVYNEEGCKKGDWRRLQDAVTMARENGYKIGIITWLTMRPSRTYEFEMRSSIEKHKWIRKNYSDLLSDGLFIAVPYGMKKHLIAKAVDDEGIHILVDDNKAIRKEWRKCGHGFHAVNASISFIKPLENLIISFS